MDTGSFDPREQLPGCEADRLPPSSAEIIWVVQFIVRLIPVADTTLFSHRPIVIHATLLRLV
jgi:hypothetical protein